MKREDGGASGISISWTICKSLPPCPRQTTIPAPHHTIFYTPDALPYTNPTVLKQ